MNKKRKIIVAIVTVIAVLAAAGATVYVYHGRHPANGQKIEKKTYSGKLKLNHNGKSDEKKGEEAVEAEEAEAFEASDGGTSDSASTSGSSGSSSSQSSASAAEGFSFPYTIPDTDLVVEKISSYDGNFFEDGSDAEVAGVNMALITNTGKTNYEYIEMTINQNEEPLTFAVSTLPAGASVVVQEKNQKPFQDGSYSGCYAVTAELPEFEMAEDAVEITENEDGSLNVSNISGEDIPCIRIFYKLYMEGSDVYVGGITYMAKLTDLKADQSQDVTPSHYLKGSSEIIMVRTYDTAE